jgi:hypothetical protein
MKLQIGVLALGAALLSASVADRAAADVITGWSFDRAPYSVGSTGQTVASNLGAVGGTGYELGFTNSISNPGTNATYTYDSVNAAGQYVNLTAPVNTLIHPYNSVSGVTSQTFQNDITSSSSSGNGSITENTWRVRSNNNLNNGNLGFSRAAPQYTQGTQWVTDTAGYSAISVSFDWFSTNQAIDLMQVQYSTDGTNWGNVGSPFTAHPNTFYSGTSPNITVSLPGDAANAAYLGVRLVTAYDPSSGSPDYTGASGGTYNNNSGNWRLDNVEFTGTAVPEPSALLLLSLGGGLGLLACRGARRRRPAGAAAGDGGDPVGGPSEAVRERVTALRAEGC